MIYGPALLFCPGDRPDRFAKAADRADSVIIDLEDAVAPADKHAAREALVAACSDSGALAGVDPARVIVRVNAASSEYFDLDLAAVALTPFTRVMVPKAERAADLDGLEGYLVIALVETPVGVREADALAADPRVHALTWGAEDLVAAIGGFASRGADGTFSDLARYARSRVLVAAAAAGKIAYETVHTALDDDSGLAAEGAEAAAAGFRGAMCLHPRQVPVLRAAYRPPAALIEWAHGVLDAAESLAGVGVGGGSAGVGAGGAGTSSGTGVFSYEGQMIDEPLLRQARRIAEASRPRPHGTDATQR